MAHIFVHLKMDPTSGRLITDPPPPIFVAPGDTIEWTCAFGDVVVSFAGQMPFEGEQKFHAAKGQRTLRAKVRSDAPQGEHFECQVTLNGKPMDNVYGVDISGG